MPKTWRSRAIEELYEQIDRESKQNGIFDGGSGRYMSWVGDELGRANVGNSFLSEYTVLAFLEYFQDLRLQKIRAWKATPPPTPEDFWNAAYDYDPLGSKAKSGPSQLQRILASGKLGMITLGKIYGHTTLKLYPTIGALPASSLDFASPLRFAATGSAAISYPDGHPSAETTLFEEGPNPKKILTIHVDKDDKLRQFAALGWIMQEDRNVKGAWRKTGHVLVMDMDDRNIRHRQPWMVLASEWPTDGEETPKGTFTIKAGIEKEVLRDDNTVHGVLPGPDTNRTSICRVIPMQDSQSNEPVLKQFGPNFDFKTLRLGGHYSARSSIYGPALANVMEWHWDPEAEQEVCYTKRGGEYMRFDRATQRYSFPDFEKMSVEGQQGLFGGLEEEATLDVERSARFITIEERMQDMSLDDDRQLVGSRQAATVEGF